MIATKTFDDFIQEGYNFPEIIPQDLQTSIYDWYKYRHVCDDNKFVEFFDRVLNRYYNRYAQLLRIEPGIAEYDWLVSQYKELQRQDTSSATDVTSLEGSTVTAQTASEEKDATNTKTYNTLDTINNDRDISESVTTSQTTSRDDASTTNREDVTDTDTTNTGLNDQKGLSRSLPMSQSTITQDANNNLSGLDWSTASGQTQATTHENGTGTVDTTVTSEETSSYESDTTASGTETRTGGITDDNTHSKTGTETSVLSDDTSKSLDETVTREDETTKTSASTGLTREITTGRNDQIAIVLENAKSFIMNTDAFEFLKDKIDTVFMGVYEI